MIGSNRLLRTLPLAALAAGALALAIVLGSGLLAQGSIIGGALFLLALIPLSMTFLREAQG
jgi:hypothetical protein